MMTHQQNIRKYCTEHTRLNDCNFAACERHSADLEEVSGNLWPGIALLTIISTAFPNVAFNKAPMTSPASLASSSVALDKSMASGNMPSMLNAKTRFGLASIDPEMMLHGTKTRSMRKLLLVRKPLRPYHFRHRGAMEGQEGGLSLCFSDTALRG